MHDKVNDTDVKRKLEGDGLERGEVGEGQNGRVGGGGHGRHLAAVHQELQIRRVAHVRRRTRLVRPNIQGLHPQSVVCNEGDIFFSIIYCQYSNEFTWQCQYHRFTISMLL